jgi:hypothetical protein
VLSNDMSRVEAIRNTTQRNEDMHVCKSQMTKSLDCSITLPRMNLGPIEEDEKSSPESHLLFRLDKISLEQKFGGLAVLVHGGFPKTLGFRR